MEGLTSIMNWVKLATLFFLHVYFISNSLPGLLPQFGGAGGVGFSCQYLPLFFIQLQNELLLLGAEEMCSLVFFHHMEIWNYRNKNIKCTCKFTCVKSLLFCVVYKVLGSGIRSPHLRLCSCSWPAIRVSTCDWYPLYSEAGARSYPRCFSAGFSDQILIRGGGTKQTRVESTRQHVTRRTTTPRAVEAAETGEDSRCQEAGYRFNRGALLTQDFLIRLMARSREGGGVCSSARVTRTSSEADKLNRCTTRTTTLTPLYTTMIINWFYTAPFKT